MAAEEARRNLGQAWHTENLVYRAITSDPADEDLIQSLFRDPLTVIMTGMANFPPPPPSYSKIIINEYLHCHMAVVICLPAQLPPPDDEERQQPVGEPANCPPANCPAAGDPIGILVLGEPRSGHSRVITGRTIHNRRAALHIVIAEPYRRRGFGAEAGRWGLRTAFQGANLHSVEVDVVSFNETSQHLCTRIGLTFEGRSREALYHVDRYWDIEHYSMLKVEFEAANIGAPPGSLGSEGRDDGSGAEIRGDDVRRLTNGNSVGHG